MFVCVCVCVGVCVCGLTNLTSGNTKGLMGPSMAWWDCDNGPMGLLKVWYGCKGLVRRAKVWLVVSRLVVPLKEKEQIITWCGRQRPCVTSNSECSH